MEKQNTKGRERMLSLFDAGTFVEMGAYIRRRGDKENEAYDAVLTGYGSVNGQLSFAFVQDSDKNAGALDSVGAEKIARLYEQAVKSGAPVIGVFDGAGAVVYDGATALAAYGKVMKCVADASGIIPQIAYISGTCLGMAATVAAMFDMTVAVANLSELYVSTPAGDLDTNGMASIYAETETDAVASVRMLVELLPRNNKDMAADEPTDDVNRPVAPADGELRAAYLADGMTVINLHDGYGKEVATALARMGGITVGLIALNGKLTAKGARKAAHLVSFCDSFSIPVVTLVDSEGVDTAADADLAPALGKLAKAYVTATAAKVTAVVGKAYGAAFTLMGSRSLGADLALATPEAVISVMDPETAVAFVWNDKITSDKSRAEVEAEWKEVYASATTAAESGDIDDIVPAEELRARIISALYMLAEKADGTPERKHGVPTL